MHLFIFIQFFMSVVFFMAALGKLVKPTAFSETMRQLGIIRLWAKSGLLIIAFLEIIACALLIIPSTLLFGQILSLILICSYVWASWKARGRLVKCNWFGGLVIEQFGVVMTLRNLIFLIMCIYMIVIPDTSVVGIYSLIDISQIILSSIGLLIIYSLVVMVTQYIKLYPGEQQ